MENRNLKISIVIPVYNEEKAIAAVVDDVKKHSLEIVESFDELSEIEVLFINDGSTDKSASIILEQIQNANHMRLINHPGNMGYGAALKTGFRNASGDIIGFYDADNTFRLQNMKILLNELFPEGLDLVSGNRFNQTSKMPLIRKLGNRFYSAILYLLTYKRIVDPASGIRLIRKRVISEKLYPLPDGLNFIIVLTTKAVFENIKYKEVQIPYEERIGKSKLNTVRDGIAFLKSILFIIQLNNLFKLYFIVTLVCLLLAGFFVYPAARQYVIRGYLRETDAFWLISFGFFLNISLVSFTFGIIANLISRTIFGKYSSHSIIGQYVTNKQLYSRFNVAGYILMILTFIVYGSMKLGFIPQHYATYILFTMLGFYGFQFLTVHYLIEMIEKQLTEAKSRE